MICLSAFSNSGHPGDSYPAPGKGRTVLLSAVTSFVIMGDKVLNSCRYLCGSSNENQQGLNGKTFSVCIHHANQYSAWLRGRGCGHSTSGTCAYRNLPFAFSHWNTIGLNRRLDLVFFRVDHPGKIAQVIGCFNRFFSGL
jgi:hypothetical protein